MRHRTKTRNPKAQSWSSGQTKGKNREEGGIAKRGCQKRTGKQEGQRTSTRILRFGPTGKVRCPEERGREVGGEVEDGAKSWNPKRGGREQWADKSGKTQRERFR